MDEFTLDRDGVEAGLVVGLAVCEVVFGFRELTFYRTVDVVYLSECYVALSASV